LTFRFWSLRKRPRCDQHRGNYDVRVEVTDELGHRAIGHDVADVKAKD
jgi:hypothetical protein